MEPPEIKVLPDPLSVAREAANRIVNAAGSSMQLHNSFSIALAGGSTPKQTYELLAGEFRSEIEWSRVSVYFTDERCVPQDDPDSNYRMASEALLSKVPLPRENVYRMRGEIDPNEAAVEYGRQLKETFGDNGLDMALLGMGQDGHTASLFPRSDVLAEPKHRCVAHYVENSTTGKSWRITMTAPFINRSEDILVLVCGASKAERLRSVLEGPVDSMNQPIQLICPSSGRLTWLIDTAAAGM